MLLMLYMLVFLLYHLLEHLKLSFEKVASLDAPIGEEENTTLKDLVKDEYSFEDDKVKDYTYCPYCAHKFNKERIYCA